MKSSTKGSQNGYSKPPPFLFPRGRKACHLINLNNKPSLINKKDFGQQKKAHQRFRRGSPATSGPRACAPNVCFWKLQLVKLQLAKLQSNPQVCRLWLKMHTCGFAGCAGWAVRCHNILNCYRSCHFWATRMRSRCLCLEIVGGEIIVGEIVGGEIIVGEIVVKPQFNFVFVCCMLFSLCVLFYTCFLIKPPFNCYRSCHFWATRMRSSAPPTSGARLAWGLL